VIERDEKVSVGTSPRERDLIEQTPKDAFIEGRWVDGDAGTFDVEDPATETVLCDVADCSPGQALEAMIAASGAFDGWRTTSPRARSEVLRRAYELVVDREDDLALLITLEMGKPLAEALGEVRYSASFLRWYAEEAVRVGGRYARQEDGRGRILVDRQPVGPCVFVTPWNFPLAMVARKVAPALAAGCTAVVKPAEQTPLAALAFGQLLAEAGVPPGVVNVVPTSDAASVVTCLLSDSRTRKVSFTGSTATGRILLRQAADQILRTSMELGGNAPFIVFADADLDVAVEQALVAKMRNGGEACTAANRFLVAQEVAEDFAVALSDRMDALRLGRGVDPTVQTGPLIDTHQLSRVQQLVTSAQAAGAGLRCGGKGPSGPGHFFEPTVLTDVPDGADLVRDEIFGPVAPITSFADEDEVIQRANSSLFGLAAYVFSERLETAMRVADRLETGLVGINQGLISTADAPFGGVKHSGHGLEGGPEGLLEYLDTKYIAFGAPR
jgi:succinate-semialdehyde dehydrogenase/glutarate-semialdehyde dehydrogenase